LQRSRYIAIWARLFLFSAVGCYTNAIFSQVQNPLTTYTTENGLSLNSVNDLLFDRQGFLWIATDGLQRFDGYRFQTFKHDPSDKKSIADNFVSGMYEDTEGNLWVSHRTGVALKPKGKFEFIDIAPAANPSAFKIPNKCVGETDSSIWIINYYEGFYAVNKKSLQVKKICSLPEYFGQDGFFDLTQPRLKNKNVWLRRRSDNTGTLFLATANGLQQFKNNNHIPVLFIIPNGPDSLVMITSKQVYKAAVKDPFTAVRILQNSFDVSALDNKYIYWPREIGNNQYLLIGTKNILLYDGNKEKIFPFSSNDYFPDELIRYLHVTTSDSHKNSWLGFNGLGGIKVISPKKFGLFKRPVNSTLPYSLAAGDNGNIYVGIYLSDIEVYDKDGDYIKTLKLPDEDKKYGSPRAMAMIDSTTLIVKSVINELYAININNGQRKILSQFLPRHIDSLLGDFESGMQRIKDGEVWLSYRNRVLSLQKTKNGFETKPVCTLPVNERINSMYYETNGRLWFCTLGSVWYFEKTIFKKISLPVSYYKHINKHPDGKIWVTSTDGVYILKDTQLVKRLNTKDGLPNSFVYSVLFDDDGNSWVSTNRGLAKIDSLYHITTYSAKEGLQGDEFNTRCYSKGPDGTLYFAGVNGINFFKPKRLISKTEASNTMLTNIEVNNQPYLPGLQPEYFSIINLPYDQNNIRLSFAYMDLTVPERNQYKFWLKGFQKDWSLPQTNNTVQYILPPGDYELLVLGANYEGVWSKEPLVLKISIRPPWYQTTLATIIFALLVLFFVGTVFYFISRNRYQKKLQHLEMEQEVQKEKQRLSRDLHDNLGSQLTWLSNTISQLERTQDEHQPIEKKLAQLKEGSGELMQTLRETIWIMNKEKISALELFDKLVNYAARHIEACPPLRLITEEKISPDLQLASGQALQLFRICQEAVTNACKHAQASELKITARSNETRFSITISDNGKGFETNRSNSSGHYGLQNMYERALESKLDLLISSSLNSGTSISVSLLQ